MERIVWQISCRGAGIHEQSNLSRAVNHKVSLCTVLGVAVVVVWVVLIVDGELVGELRAAEERQDVIDELGHAVAQT